jgi:TetR/AcrR family transcriptional regulator, transcriptional repressor for nem operon
VPRGDARPRLLEAARDMIRERGYAATTIDELCRTAGVTKGAFFHHFSSKDALGVAVAEHWLEIIDQWFSNAPYHSEEDPAERLLSYVRFRIAILDRSVEAFSCLVGAMASEVYRSHPAIREACARTIEAHALGFEPVIAAAMEARRMKDVAFTPKSLAMFIHGTLQGAFVLAKATDGAEVARRNIEHLERYLTMLFFPERTDP